ncbi:MAG: DCC1-like thiol-disulfide oxidoreductase family protein [Candidatus Bipolaricaulia bacterium]
MPDTLLIYDGDCRYCRTFVRLLAGLDRQDRFVQRPFDAPDAQAVLRAQFGDAIGFAMYLVEADRVSWGARAAERVVEKLGGPRPLKRPLKGLALRLYPWLLGIVSRLSGREREVCGPACAVPSSGPTDAGRVPLVERAAVELRRVVNAGPAQQSTSAASSH